MTDHNGGVIGWLRSTEPVRYRFIDGEHVVTRYDCDEFVRAALDAVNGEPPQGAATARN